MAGRLTSSHFVGRATELRELERAAAQAASGQPVLVLLGGQSGVGKTRLIGELERRLTGALVLRGESLEQESGELPYAPLLGALRQMTRASHPALSRLSAGSRAQLAALLPSLGEVPAGRGADESAGQVRLFEALFELLALAAEDETVVLVLEDMHWADRSTRTFTDFLARSLRTERLLLALTYRSDELQRRHPLRPLLAELGRLERSLSIQLAAFDRAELTEALADILGAEPSAPIVDRMLDRTEGNPLYIEELLAASLDGRGAAPQSLKDAFMIRVERLSAPARAVAGVVAVARRCDERTIAAASGIEGDDLHAAIREALAENVLVSARDDTFAIRHELLREALYDDLLPGERGGLHVALAQALERLRGAGVDGDADVERTSAIASHYAAAREQPAALRATVTAAVVAEEVQAYGEAAQAAERALELWPRVAAGERPQTIDHVGLLVLAARAHGMGGDRGRGEVLLRSALDELDPASDPGAYGALLARLARMQWRLNRGRESLDTAARALELLDHTDGGTERAALLAWLARTRVLRGRYRDAITEGEEALEAVRAAGDAIAESEVLNTLGMARTALGDVDAGVANLHRAREIAVDQGDFDAAASASANLADMLNLRGRSADALEVATAALADAPVRLLGGRDWLALTISELAITTGDWQLAREHPGPPRAQAAGVTLMFRLLRDAELALGIGDHDHTAMALDAVDPLVRITSEAQWHGLYGALRGELERRGGDLDAAGAAISRALDELETCTDDVMRIARVSAVGLTIEADRALRGRDLGDRALTRDAIKRARLHMQRLRAAAQAGGPVERAWRDGGAAELARARGASDPSLWERASQTWSALGRPYCEAVTLYRDAEAWVQREDRRRAAAPAGGRAGDHCRLGRVAGG